MSNVVSSAIFCVRNVDKAENQDKIGRWAVAVGQAKKITDTVASLDNNVFGDAAKASINALKIGAKNEKLLEYAGKAVHFASENINPLICVSAGIDVISSDDKGSALVTNATALTTMFTAEKMMKKHMDEIPKMERFQKYTKRFVDFAEGHRMGKLPTLIHGVAFVLGSCTAYNVGEKFGNLLVGKKDNGENPEENPS